MDNLTAKIKEVSRLAAHFGDQVHHCHAKASSVADQAYVSFQMLVGHIPVFGDPLISRDLCEVHLGKELLLTVV